MTESKISPFAKAALTMALISCSVAILTTLSLVALRWGIDLAGWVLIGGVCAIVWALAPLTLLAILIGIIHKLMAKQAFAAWKRLGLAFLLTCVSVAGAVWVISGVVVG